METKRFSKNDDCFICENCGKVVNPLKYSSRDHCPYCLHSKHVDINPGDRANDCDGLLVPIGLDYNSNKGYIIVYKCKKCGKVHRNVVAKDDSESEIIKLSAHGGSS